MRTFVQLFLSIGFALTTQFATAQDDACSLLIKHTSVVVHKAQKTMLIHKKTDAGGRLANAALLQSYAVKLYAQKKQEEAACLSAEARKLAGAVICELNAIKSDPYFELSETEKPIVKNCADEKTMLKNASAAMKELSGKTDADYLKVEALHKSGIDLH